MSCRSTGSSAAALEAAAGTLLAAEGMSTGGALALAAPAGTVCACTADAASSNRVARPRVGRRWKTGMQVTPLNGKTPRRGAAKSMAGRGTTGGRGNSPACPIGDDERAASTVPASTVLAQPGARIHRLAALAQLEVDAGVDASDRAGGADRLARLDLVADAVQQALVVAVHAHPAVAVVDDDQHTVAAQEAGVDHPSARHRMHLAAGGGLDQHAVAEVVDRAAGRPGQLAANVGGSCRRRQATPRRGGCLVD